MLNWGFWEWVAYAALFIGAIILATDQGIKLITRHAENYVIVPL